ncbi:helix-turn-helix domain-containing protein [Leptothoe kymatousa]|uniref:Helix-turn-helix transcriptional regulator n=1 Tax=Leptothoe kymatousa TAU-MAC 1615 TaxID=2364775 RepID=A0ABS5Y6U5_9CYAN|nr:AraC family transcriptional regulator [Leptothoe kymatousa]MBT9313228.1 helix-turn-helix transcriptional regulator [Leptothoe kymatousa TAU-MAC 1615]
MSESAPLPAYSLPPSCQPGTDESKATMRITQLHNAASGEGPYHCADGHTLFMSLAPRPVHYLQKQDGKTYTGLYQKGELLITPANTPLFVRWEGIENCLQIQLTDAFLKRIAGETFGGNGERLQLVPSFQQRDGQVEAIANLILTEYQQNPTGNQLYTDSLANILAVNLLRQFATTQRQLPTYAGGLPQRQLIIILDYIDAHLDQEIKLASLAALVDMSQFHLSHLFKQSMGLSPYQYLLQQRIERAKQLLQTTDGLIADIALECGFNSHSHLTKQFRKATGITPKIFRTNKG